MSDVLKGSQWVIIVSPLNLHTVKLIEKQIIYATVAVIYTLIAIGLFGLSKNAIFASGAKPSCFIDLLLTFLYGSTCTLYIEAL
jgi:hypothetical protein